MCARLQTNGVAYGRKNSFAQRHTGKVYIMAYLLSSQSICGTDVRNAQGEDLGHIEEIMVDPSNGKTAYAVLSFGGFLGLGDKLFAVPFSRLNVDREDEKMILDVDKERLKEAPGFDKDNWPDFHAVDSAYRTSVDSYYG